MDAFFVELWLPGQYLVDQACYWYSVWAHRRDGLWKGFLQVKLAPDEDSRAGAVLAATNAAGGRP